MWVWFVVPVADPEPVCPRGSVIGTSDSSACAELHFTQILVSAQTSRFRMARTGFWYERLSVSYQGFAKALQPGDQKSALPDLVLALTPHELVQILLLN
jgi:hypothetical protein